MSSQPAIYVPDVPEFSSLVDAARNTPGVELARRGDYWRLSAADELRFSRRGLRLKPAVWYGIFTGGLVGRIAEMTPNFVRIVGPTEGAA